MISVDRALALLAETVRPRDPRACPREAAQGLVLAEDVTSDVDSPPHDKSLVDGYALHTADLVNGQAELTIVEQVVAGEVPRLPLGRGQATRIMTGAPLPGGADAVAMIERATVVGEAPGRLGRVLVRDSPLVPGRNLMRQGESIRAGDVVLARGTRLGPAQLGLAAEVGRAELNVVPRARVAVLSTGNELVPPEVVPGPGQIRNSNGPMLAALVREAGCDLVELGVARDEPAELSEKIVAGLASDVLVLSGGVSAGLLDLVPSLLAEAGVRQVFHKVELKPGKPLWFGVGPHPAGERLVFGLPGNPVSSFVCFRLFVRPALRRLQGLTAWTDTWTRAPLAAEFVQKGDRPTYHPARWSRAEGVLAVEPVRWRGSADLRGLAAAEVLVHFPAGDHRFAAGEMVDVLPLGAANS